MKKNKQLVTLLYLSFLYAPHVCADNMVVKIGGKIDFSTAILQQEPKAPKPVTLNNEDFGFLTIADLYVDISNEADNGVKYGAKVSAQTTTQNSRAVPSFLYFESNIGRLEFGSNKSAYSKMSISGYTNACSVDWSRWSQLDSTMPYISGNANFLDSYNRTSGQVEYSRKVSYYTPDMQGWKVGLTYVPDTSNAGYTSPGDNILYGAPTKYVFEGNDGNYNVGYEFAIKNAVAGGISWT